MHQHCRRHAIIGATTPSAVRTEVRLVISAVVQRSSLAQGLASRHIQATPLRKRDVVSQEYATKLQVARDRERDPTKPVQDTANKRKLNAKLMLWKEAQAQELSSEKQNPKPDNGDLEKKCRKQGCSSQREHLKSRVQG
eukprot:1921541-Pleurochrysis_carterae.AAC.4